MTDPIPLPLPVAILPKEARDLLIAATRVRSEHARRIAIDAAIDTVKLRYPNYFQPTPSIKE